MRRGWKGKSRYILFMRRFRDQYCGRPMLIAFNTRGLTMESSSQRGGLISPVNDGENRSRKIDLAQCVGYDAGVTLYTRIVCVVYHSRALDLSKPREVDCALQINKLCKFGLNLI